MATVANVAHFNSICMGCLSRDRLLDIVEEEGINRVYYSIIHEQVPMVNPLVLCWECLSNISRYMTFRRQCVRAHGKLLQHMLTPENLTSLSKLSIVRNSRIINLRHSSNTNCDNILYLNHKCEQTTHTVEESKVYQRSNQFEVKTDKSDNTTQSEVSAEQSDSYKGTVKNEIAIVKQREIDIEFIKTERIESLKVEKLNEDDAMIDHSCSDDKNTSVNPKLQKWVTDRVRKQLQQLNIGEGQLEMVVLSWEQVEEERQKALSNIVFTRHEYRCPDCVVGFNHKFKLENHNMKKHESSAGDVVCSVCKVRFRDADALRAHRRQHRVRWRCCLCGDMTSRASIGADHVAREHHASAPTHTCNVCGHAEPTLSKLRNHAKNHGERQKCNVCSKTFRDRSSLRTHLLIHGGEKEYACQVCNKRFLFKKSLETHMVTHDAPEYLYCYQCDMTFKNRISYAKHMNYSLKHIDPAKLKFACPVCDKRFAKAARLQEHHVAVHTKATPIACSLPGCSFTCSSRPVLGTHVRMVHRNGRAVRNHVCDTCGKAYMTKKNLEGHMRSHTGERPFSCALCPAAFGYEATLYNHNKLVHALRKVDRRPPQTPSSPQEPEPIQKKL